MQESGHPIYFHQKKEFKEKNFDIFFFQKLFKDHFFMKTFANWAQIVRGEKVHLDNIAFNYLVLTSKKKEGFLRGKNEKKMRF